MPHPLQSLSPEEEILFTRQRHEADKMGLHWDYRLVHGDKAYSWATKKEMPEPGKATLLFEQPVHTSHYALSDRVEIPAGQYGAGTTTLDFVRKAKVYSSPEEPDKLVLETKDGQKFLIKKMGDGKFGDKAWLFRNLTKQAMTNKYLTKIATLFYPHQTPHEVDLAFTGGANPTADRIRRAASKWDDDAYNSMARQWRGDAVYLDKDDLQEYLAEMPLRSDYNHLRDLHNSNEHHNSFAGKAVEGPSKMGLGLGYGLGAAGLAAGIMSKNPLLALGGAATAGVTGLYHNYAQPEKRYNRYLERAEWLKDQKDHLLEASREDGV